MARPHELLIISDPDKAYLKEMLAKGTYSSRELKRAEILLKGDEGYTVAQIAETVDRHPQTVRNIRRRYIEEGLESALAERPRPGKPRKLFVRDESLIATIACSDAPSGHSSWTLRMISDKFIQLSEGKEISHETVRQVLKKTSSNPGKKRNGV